MASDGELLGRYLTEADEKAFRDLVQRYVHLVYSTARRIVGDAQRAEDITQVVFARLAGRAARLRNDSVLAGWLHADTRLVSLDELRRERRRRKREEIAMQEVEAPDIASWQEISPLIDEALDRLPIPERDAVLLRVFEQRSFEEVGTLLGIGQDAARMRVNRALEKVRTWLGRRGVRSSTAALGTLLAAFGLEHAPVSLAGAAATFAAGGGWAVGNPILGGIIMSKLKIAVGTALICGLGTTVLVQQRRHATLSRDNATLHDQLAAAQTDHEDYQNRLQALTNDILQIPALRSEIARLRAELTKSSTAPAGVAAPQPQVPAPVKEVGLEPAPWTETEVAEFLNRPAAEQGRFFGAFRASGLSRSSENPQEFARNRELAQRVRPELENLERRPEDYAAFQTEFIKAVAGLPDGPRIAQIQELLRSTCQQAVDGGLDAPSKPQDKTEEWMLRRDALDRPATRALEALLSDSEREKFGRSFLGVMGIDLGTGDGGWHRFKSPQGGFVFPSDQRRSLSE